MNINMLKAGFINYLQEILKLEGNNEAEFNTNNDISIFLYANEFKDYIEKEIGTAELEYSLAAMNINEILDLEIENGQLILPDSVETENENDNDNANANEQENTNENETDKSKSFFASIIGTLLDQDEVKNIVDTDKDGNYSENEVNNFFTSMNGLDEDDKIFSLNDIFSTVDKIANNDFKIEEKVTTDVSNTNTNKREENSTGLSTSNNSIGNNRGFSQGGNNTINANLDKSPKTMSLKELTDTEAVAENAITQRQKVLNETIDGNTPEIQLLQRNVDYAYISYNKILESVQTEDETFSEDIAAKKEEISSQQKTVNEKDKSIEEKDSAIEGHKANILTIESTITSLEATKSNLAATLNNEETNPTSINNQINDISGKIEELEFQKTDEQKAQTEAETEKTELEEEKTNEEKTLTNLEKELTEIQNQAEQAHPEIADARQIYDEAQKVFTSEKEIAVNKAKTAITESQTYLNEIKENKSKITTKLIDNQAQGTIKFATSGYNEEAGQAIAEAGFKEARRRNTGGYCLAGVASSLLNVYNINMCDTIGSAYLAADILRGNVEEYKDLASHFNEVEFSKEDLKTLPAGAVVVWDQSIGEHGHISISDGHGNEASDHTQLQAQCDGNFAVFLPTSL